jgi:hypothetical protein
MATELVAQTRAINELKKSTDKMCRVIENLTRVLHELVRLAEEDLTDVKNDSIH